MKYESEESSGSKSQCVTDPQSGVQVALPPYALRSGPRRTIYHDPSQVTAALVTCGGLCPGLNDVVQNIVYTLDDYGVPEDQIFGIRYGWRGFLTRHAGYSSTVMDATRSALNLCNPKLYTSNNFIRTWISL